jgi:hypothetical protein
VAVGHRHGVGGLDDRLDRGQVAVVQARGTRLPNPGDRDRGGVRAPDPDQLGGHVEVAAGADPQEPERAVEEPHVDVVVAVRAGQADVDDEQRGHLGHQAIAFEPISGWSTMNRSRCPA